MRPDFKTINITADAFGAQHAPIAQGEEWLTPELIPKDSERIKNVFSLI
jgi:hypothetical protein